MDIKDLNKAQLILLAVLISFITSIATGITTVTLMQQAPPSVTTPINRVIRETVEKIQQVEGKPTVRTIVVKEEDLVVDAIAKNKSAVFGVSKEIVDEAGRLVEVSAGRGFALSKDGIVAADGDLLNGAGAYFLKNDSGKFKADLLYTDKTGFAFLKLGSAVNGGDKAAFTVPTLGDLGKMKAGQKVLVFGNTLTSFIFDGNKDIRINVPKSSGGAVLLDLDGNVLGMALSGETDSFASANAISSASKLSFGSKEKGAESSLPASPGLAP